jgi:hypothetical protein
MNETAVEPTPSDGMTENPAKQEQRELTDEDWLIRAREAYRFSTTYLDSNYRKEWEDSIRAFNNQHPADSKYNSETFAKRSKVVRPKTRSVIRKNEAAAAAAFFSNVDRVQIKAVNQGDQQNRVTAEIMQELLQQRLTKSIPWFQVVCGAAQDAQVQGVCVAHAYWKFAGRRQENGDIEIHEDKPCIDLRPIENIRIDPAASWLDPINTSPYVIDCIPMYVCDVKQRMEQSDFKGRKWHRIPDELIGRMSSKEDDSTRMTRLKMQQDPMKQDHEVSDYDIVWIHRHIHRHYGHDWEFYTLGSEHLLSEPELLKKSVLHGQRPYVMGFWILETHKPYPNSVPTLSKGLQEEASDIANQRLDNVKLVLNKRWLARRAGNVDTSSLIRNVPGAVTLVDDIERDIKEVNWPDVTSSAFQEQDRINADFDELQGNFSAASMQMSRAPREPARAMTLLQAPANLLTEYGLKTFTETFVVPVMRQLVMLEQAYETDVTLLAVAGQKSPMYKKLGLSRINDEILEHELEVNINMGMGATDPVTKLQRFLLGMHSFAEIAKMGAPGVSLQEIAKEIFALSGYQDGDRFFLGQDPDKAQAEKQIRQLAMTLGQKVKDKSEATQAKVLTTRETNATRERIAAMQIRGKVGTEIIKHRLGADQHQGDQAFEAEKMRSEQGFQMQTAQQPQMEKQAAAKDGAELKGIVKELAKSQETLTNAILALAQIMHGQMKKPKKRTGKALLPSGGEMTFEMSDA